MKTAQYCLTTSGGLGTHSVSGKCHGYVGQGSPSACHPFKHNHSQRVWTKRVVPSHREGNAVSSFFTTSKYLRAAVVWRLARRYLYGQGDSPCENLSISSCLCLPKPTEMVRCDPCFHAPHGIGLLVISSSKMNENVHPPWNRIPHVLRRPLEQTEDPRISCGLEIQDFVRDVNSTMIASLSPHISSPESACTNRTYVLMAQCDSFAVLKWHVKANNKERLLK